MTDKTKTCLSALFYMSMIIMPILGLAIGWVGWNLQTGIVTALVLFGVFFFAGGIVLATVKDLSMVAASLPLIMGVVYLVLPDFIPGPFDDAIVMASSSMLTFTLWLRRQPETPKWVVFPLLVASLYTLVGSVIPGPVDELVVTILAVAASGYGVLQNSRPRQQLGSGNASDSPRTRE